MNLFSLPYVPHVPPISFFLIWLPEYYLERSTDHKTPRYAISSIPLLLHPSKAQNVFLIILWGETSKRFLHVGHSYNTISETVRNPIKCKQKCASDGGRKTNLSLPSRHSFRITAQLALHAGLSAVRCRRRCLSVPYLGTNWRSAVACALCACIQEVHRSNLDQSVCQLS